MTASTQIPRQCRAQAASRAPKRGLAGATGFLVALTLAFAPASVARSAPLSLGFLDQYSFVLGSPKSNATWLATAHRLGASFARLNVNWNYVAPNPPSGPAQAADPLWAGYLSLIHI